MRKILVALIFAVLFAGSAFAGNPILAKAKIPFDFSANGQTLQRGDYELRYIGQGLYRLENLQNHSGLIINSQSSISQSEGLKLIFRSYDSQYFLGEICDNALQFSAFFSESKLERIAKNRAKNRVVLALAFHR